MGARAASSAPVAAMIATATIVPPNRLDTGTPCNNPETPTKTGRNAPGKRRTRTGATKKRKNAAPTAVRSPANRSQRETTSLKLGPWLAGGGGGGGGRPAPTREALRPPRLA